MLTCVSRIVRTRAACAALVWGTLAGVSGASVGAATIYADPFAGSSANNLNGTVPPTDNYAGSAGPHAWSANAIYKADGSVTTSPASGSAALPFVPTAGYIYSLTANVNTTVGGSDWISIGFEQTNDINQYFSYTGGYGTILLRNNRGAGQAQTFAGPGATNLTNVDSPSGVVALGVTLDTRAANWTVAFSENGTQVGNTFTYATNPTINFVNLSKYSLALGTVSNFSLSSSVPEPGAMGVAGVGTLTLLVRRRRAM